VDILGISAFYHDSAACLIRDGRIIAATQEERFTRRKHDAGFPINAIRYCLEEGKIQSENLDLIAFYDKPFIKFERILLTYLTYAPLGLRSFLKAMPLWLKQKLWIKQLIADQLSFKGKILFPEHHESHAASAFFPSPFKEAAILTIDGVGEWTTASFGTGKHNSIRIHSEIHFPHSLGLLYSAFTYFTGFRVNSGEYKLMGLAPYGEPKYVQLIYDHLIDLKSDGSFRMNMKYFNYCAGLTMTNRRFSKLFGGPPRKPESEITQREMDIARSIQNVTEEIMLRMSHCVYKETRMKNLALAGGVALNCVGNGRVLREGPFEDIWIQPAAGDAGGALGAALYIWYQYLQNERHLEEHADMQQASLLGPQFSKEYIENFLQKEAIAYKDFNGQSVEEHIARLLSEGKVIGLFQGRMEFGPRALGSRSIIGDARSAEMQSKMNLKIKYRESFRPFAPAVIKERVQEYFDLDKESPYMLLVASVAKDRWKNHQSADLTGLDKLRVLRSEIPAVTHVDYSARIQTVDQKNNPKFFKLLNAFYQQTGCPVVINTSFNVRGEPIVCTPEDAYNCFMNTEMDHLVLENFVIEKNQEMRLQHKQTEQMSDIFD
jgi:carbamoyltransferase